MSKSEALFFKDYFLLATAKEDNMKQDFSISENNLLL